MRRAFTPHPRRWLALAAVLLGVAAVLVTLAIQGPAAPEHTAPEPTPGATGSSAPPSTRPAADLAPAAPAAPPQHLTIASIGVSTPLVRLGLNDDRTVEVPQNPDRAGWFDQGPPPGQSGSSVILGHVDSTEGPAVFHELSQLEPGALIEVTLDGGAVATFRVDRVETYANEDFPARAVYAGDPERRALNLVTCGGEYDAARGGWQSNVIAFTEHVRTIDP
ncbi:MAG: class F sortase [Nocardioides sp.]|nr:class F sortase [Nocardioides sp.]